MYSVNSSSFFLCRIVNTYANRADCQAFEFDFATGKMNEVNRSNLERLATVAKGMRTEFSDADIDSAMSDFWKHRHDAV